MNIVRTTASLLAVLLLSAACPVDSEASKVRIRLRLVERIAEIKAGATEGLTQPVGAAFDAAGGLYVLDGLSGRVFVLDTAGRVRSSWVANDEGAPQTAPGKVFIPSLAVDGQGRVYVSDPGRGVRIFDAAGARIAALDLGTLLAPHEPDPEKRSVARVACGPRNWYLVDDKNDRVYLLSYGANEVVASFGGSGTGAGELRGPRAVAVEPVSGDLAVADTFNFRVQVFSAGRWPREFGSYGNSVGQFGRLLGVAWEGRTILTLDYMNSDVQGFDEDGRFLFVLGEKKESAFEVLPRAAPTGFALHGDRLAIAHRDGVLLLRLLPDMVLPGRRRRD